MTFVRFGLNFVVFLKTAASVKDTFKNIKLENKYSFKLKHSNI